MNIFRTILASIGLCLLAAACRNTSHPTPPASRQAAADSLVKYMYATINPHFVDENVSASRRILDSLAPVVKQYDHYSFTCAWLRFMGMQYLLEKKYDSALINYRQALAIATEKDTTLKQVVAAKTQLSELFRERKQLDSALVYAREAYYLAKKVDTSGLPMILLKLTTVYFDIGDMAALRNYLFEGFTLSANKPKYRLAFANNIATYYDNLRETDSSLQFYKDFVENDSSLSSSWYDAIKYENFGIQLTRKDKLEEGLQYQLKALELNRKLDRVDAATLFNTAVTYSKLHRFDTAATYLDQALELATKEKDLETITSIWRRRSSNLSMQQRYREALAALDSSYTHYELEVDSSLANKARELETQYAVKAKDDEIHTLAFSNEANRKIGRQQQWIIIILASAFALLGILGFMFWRRRKLAEKLKQTSLEQRLLRSQMEPHFIFNTLSVLQSFIRNNEGEKAIRYLNQFARLLRVTLENSRESFVPLKEEVTALENYLSLQAMRFEGSFDYHVHVYDGYEEDELMIPPMLLQPFVENAILHGMKQLNRKGHIEVTISRELHVLRCVIDDNGAGIQASPAPPQKRSLSTMITQERLAILSRQTRQPASISIIDKSQEQSPGTRVVLHIPFRKTLPFDGSRENANGF
jgi:tetratricopeptide (TPR) repeat protein